MVPFSQGVVQADCTRLVTRDFSINIIASHGVKRITTSPSFPHLKLKAKLFMQDVLVSLNVRQPSNCASKGLLHLMLAPEWLNKSHQLCYKLIGIAIIY